MSTYLQRYEILLSLGFNSYQEYLESPLWKSIRAKQLRKHRWCICCFKRANQVHHRRYDLETLLGKDTRALVSICEACHKKIEFTKEGKKIEHIGVINRKLDVAIQNKRNSRRKVRNFLKKRKPS